MSIAQPNQELSGAMSELQGEPVGVCSFYKMVGILHYEACKCAYLYILISEAPTNKIYEEKISIEARKTIFLR